jgi:hypothetical protein
MADLELGSTRKFYCNTCGTETHHGLVALQRQPHYVYGEDALMETVVDWYEFQYRFWVCRGCDTALLETAWTSMGIEDEEGNQIWESEVDPKRMVADRSSKHFRQLNPKLTAIYREVVVSLNAGLKVTCAMGLRALLEGICVDKGVTDEDAWGFEAKLEKLKDRKLLPSHIVDCFHSFKFIGDSAAHRLEAPSKEELELAIDVIEDLLNFLYELEYSLAAKAKRLAEKRSTEMEDLKRRKEARKGKGSSATDQPEAITETE